MNKNISIWRGSQAPPTIHHVWIKENNTIYLHNGNNWDPVIDSDAYETLLDYLQQKESFPKIDVINEIPDGNDFKNGEFQLYKLGQDITIPSPECYEFGKTNSFTIREGDLCLIGKIEHTPTSLQAEHPKFSDKYKYKIRFDANLNYYFGGVGNIGNPVLTTTTQPLTYSLIGSENKFIIKCGNYYAFISGDRLSLTDQLSNAAYFILRELEPNKFEFLNYDNQSTALNAHQGLGIAGNYSDEIRWYNSGRPGNIVQFLPQESDLIIKKIISTQEATTSYSGLMSKEDKLKLDGLQIVQLNTPSNSNSIASYELRDHNSIKLGATINIPKDTSIKDIQVADMNATINNAGEIIEGLPKGNTALCIVYTLANGTYKLVKLDYQSFFEETEISNGLQINNHKVSVKVDPASESYLTVGPNGVKLEGIDQTVDRVSTIWGGNKELPMMEVVTNYTIKNQSGTKVTDTSSISTLEYGYKVDITSNLRWIHNNTCKDPTSTSGNWGTVLPNSNQYITLTKSNIDENTTFTQTIYADKTGLMVKGDSIVPAEGQDSKSVSISIPFKHRVYQGGTTTNNPTETIIKSLNSELSGKSKTITGVTADNTQYYYYAYPKSLGELTKIIQDGALSVLSAFTKKELQITNDAGLSIDMLVYVSNNKGAFTNNTLKFE